MKGLAFLSLLICLFILSQPSLAAIKLSLREIEQKAFQHNKDLKAARYNLAIAKARLIQSGLLPNPIVYLSSNDDKAFTNEGEYSRGVILSQALPVSGRIAKQKNLALIDIFKARAELRERKRQLSANIANDYYSTLITERRIQQQNYLLSLNKQLVKVTTARFKVAEVSELDNNIAILEFQRLKQEKQLLISQKISQLARLNQYMNIEANKPLELINNLPLIDHWPELNLLQLKALKCRPDRRNFILNIERAKRDNVLAKAGRFADWTLGVGVQQDKIFVSKALPQNPDRTLALNLSIPLPILNGNQGRILETSHVATQGYLSLQSLNLAIQTEVASNYFQLKLLSTALLDANQSKKLMLKNIHLAREAYKNGQLSLLNLIQIQRQQNDLQVTYLNNLEKYLQVYVGLCTAISVSTNGICSYLSLRDAK
ncbi:MAG: TolC family protein [Proteobacteria bacterium]|nr:TolC family protein [Pseudomonadota bacterium]